MHIELNPPHGVAPLDLGMPLEEAVAACGTWGDVSVSRGVDGIPTLVADHPRFEVVAHLADGAGVTSVEVWRPRPKTRPESPEITVRFRGVDVFRPPAREVLSALASLGFTVEDRRTPRPRFPELALVFTREPHDGDPRDRDGLPLHFARVLVARAGYRGDD